MDVSKLVRDADKVKSHLHEMPDGRLVAKKPCKIYIPVRFSEVQLAEIGIETYITGIYAMTVEDKFYAVSLVNAMIRIEPTSMMKVDVEGDEYYEFSFQAGATITPSVMLVKNDTLTYRIFDEIFSKGRVPWYLGLIEMCSIFDSARYHAGANVGTRPEVIELIVSMIARNPDDRHQGFRELLKTQADLARLKPAVIPLKSVTYAATNTINKFAGSHFNEGLISALVTPAERVERVESIVRK